MHWSFIVPIILSLLTASVWADTLKPIETEKRSKVILSLSSKLGTDFSNAQVYPSNLPGYYLVNIDNSFIFVSHNLKHLIHGQVLDIDSKVDLAAAAKQQHNLNVLASLDVTEAVTYKPTGKSLTTLSIFTDIDCGYCRKLHREITELNNAGITVNYYAFPRTGPNTPSWRKAKHAWCAENTQQALTDAKRGNTIRSKQQANCSVDIALQYETGRRLGVTGTPTLILETGEPIPGYVPSNRLIPRLLAAVNR